MCSKNETNSKVYQRNRDLEVVFDDILFACEEVLCDDQKDPLEFLDPIISDSQCHIHAMFIVGKLLQLNDRRSKFGFKNLKSLPNMDRMLLSYAVLLSVLKYEETGADGFVKIRRLIEDIGILSGRVNAEKKFIYQLKETFNSHSIEYLRDVAGGKLKKLLEECDVRLYTKKRQPCYVSFYTIFKYMAANDLPIIVTLVRFKTGTGQPDSKLSITGKSLLYFQYQKSKNSFVYKSKKTLSEVERDQPTIVFTCFSVITNNYPEYYEEFMEGSQLPSDKFLTEDCDIRELLLLTGAGHIQLSDIVQMKDETRTEDYVQQLYRKYSNLSLVPRSTPFTGNFDLIEDNVYGCYQHHYKVAQRYGIVDARYSYRSKCVDNTTETSALVIRRNENTFFNIEHVIVSTYNRECTRINTFVVGAEVPLIESENFSKTKAQEYVASKLAVLISIIK